MLWQSIGFMIQAWIQGRVMQVTALLVVFKCPAQDCGRARTLTIQVSNLYPLLETLGSFLGKLGKYTKCAEHDSDHGKALSDRLSIVIYNMLRARRFGAISSDLSRCLSQHRQQTFPRSPVFVPCYFDCDRPSFSGLFGRNK
jgi:hypothetical protein